MIRKFGTRKQNRSMPHEKPIYGTTFLNPVFILKENDSIKIVMDARHLNSKTDQSFEPCPLEPLAMQLAGNSKIYKSAIDLFFRVFTFYIR